MKKLLLLAFFSFSLSAASLGETLFNGNCVTCHAITSPNSAPAIQEVQHAYKKMFDTKEKFVAFMVNWIAQPNTKTTLMPEAIKKHGLMPSLGYDKETLQEIASYLYDARLSQ
ncbi:c-type cytochrome [Sulfurospirillum oryzae]|uniref:c-type cytochrome n=1 Tax=Sulfurospirillum oryzae TaxID=2976535 RepID=UPI0021E79965|nr:c-type cytochrome [Sulfurospirillum oryzae]